MTKAEKEKKVVELKEVFENSSVTIINSISNISVSEITKVRREVKESGCQFMVVKNSLARLAVIGTDLDELKDSFKGSVVISVGYDDPTIPAKILKKYLKDLDGKLDIVCGIVEGNFVEKSTVLEYAELPGKEELIGQLLARLNSPISGLHGVTSGVIRKLVYALQAVQEQKK